MTIKEFIDECNRVVKDVDYLKPSKNADELRDDAIYVLHHHFTMDTGKVYIIPITVDGVNAPDTVNCMATAFTIKKDDTITLTTGESIDVELSIRFKTSLVGTGKMVKVSKTNTVEKMAIADEFVSLDGADIVYKIPHFAIYEDNKVSTTGFFNQYESSIPATSLDMDHTIDDVFDDVFATIDKAKVESDYNIRLCEAVDWEDVTAQYIRKNYTIVPRDEVKLPSINDFIEECNKVVRESDIGTSDSASDVKMWAIERLFEHFSDISISLYSRGSGSTFELEKDYTLTLSTGEVIPVTMEVYFKTSAKRTGKLIKMSKTKSKYEMMVSDKFIKFDKINLLYYIPDYRITDDHTKLEIDGYPYNKTYIDDDKIDKNRSIDDIIESIDITPFDCKYNNALVNSIFPKVFHKGHEDLRDKLIDCISMEDWRITDWDGVLSYIRNNCEIDTNIINPCHKITRK